MQILRESARRPKVNSLCAKETNDAFPERVFGEEAVHHPDDRFAWVQKKQDRKWENPFLKHLKDGGENDKGKIKTHFRQNVTVLYFPSTCLNEISLQNDKKEKKKIHSKRTAGEISPMGTDLSGKRSWKRPRGDRWGWTWESWRRGGWAGRHGGKPREEFSKSFSPPSSTRVLPENGEMQIDIWITG